ncbi:phosphopantetheine-binding protein [Roseibium polysiphoniae]|uniref:phosphopantetheine-binding protein n=1 Tax=Roseibium polysiphoniae TaxID=2571221 RepID=UPI0032974505
MSLDTTEASLVEKLFRSLVEATDNSLKESDISQDTRFTEAGMSSIEYLKFVDLVEAEFNVTIDLNADGDLDSIGKFSLAVQKQGVKA